MTPEQRREEARLCREDAEKQRREAAAWQHAGLKYLAGAAIDTADVLTTYADHLEAEAEQTVSAPSCTGCPVCGEAYKFGHECQLPRCPEPGCGKQMPCWSDTTRPAFEGALCYRVHCRKEAHWQGPVRRSSREAIAAAHRVLKPFWDAREAEKG